MPHATTYTRDQLHAAFVRWEQDVRLDRTKFASDEECRNGPVEGQADALVDALLGYVSARGAESGHSKRCADGGRVDALHVDAFEIEDCASKLPGSVTIQVCPYCASIVENFHLVQGVDEPVESVVGVRGVLLNEDPESHEGALCEVGRLARNEDEFHVVERGPYSIADGWRMGVFSVNGWNFSWSEGESIASGEFGEPRKTRESARRGAELIRDALQRGVI
ncbi:hypothetical protein WT72_30315 [Burkholderia pseudomultivorans]|uniref:hypothetical protein n=1 Tax=Burkholderia pseudomultivorans TaxID=1207504 RepID=UPI00075BC02B|nr:hypothetical protein [Burkholderia pseudomultivorans]KWI47869.1 hypothetical protein WT72_30315 [Burkholderia pseudomultivorans]